MDMQNATLTVNAYRLVRIMRCGNDIEKVLYNNTNDVTIAMRNEHWQIRCT